MPRGLSQIQGNSHNHAKEKEHKDQSPGKSGACLRFREDWVKTLGPEASLASCL